MKTKKPKVEKSVRYALECRDERGEWHRSLLDSSHTLEEARETVGSLPPHYRIVRVERTVTEIREVVE